MVKKKVPVKHELKRRIAADNFLAQVMMRVLPTSEGKRALEALWRFDEGTASRQKRESLVNKYAKADGTTRVPTSRFHSLFIPLGDQFWLAQAEYFKEWSRRFKAMPDSAGCKRLWSLNYERGMLVNQAVQLFRQMVYAPSRHGPVEDVSDGPRVLQEQVAPPIGSVDSQREDLQRNKRMMGVVEQFFKLMDESDNQDETLTRIEIAFQQESGKKAKE